MGVPTETFDSLWNQTHHRLCWFVCSRISNEQDAEDILQDVFLRIYDQFKTVRDPQRLESWMYQVARNRIVDHYRGRRQWVDLPETLAAEDDLAERTPESLLTYLREMVGTLPKGYREALIQADMHGMSHQELATKLGITLPGAKSRVQRARQKVKDAMLHCFDFEFDARGQIMDYHRRCCC
jgi:RNA polymerase sigma-70 factor, ECF subfamily